MEAPAPAPAAAGVPEAGVVPGPPAINPEVDAARLVYVGNLPYSTKWQELKDHMKEAGTVEFARILTEDGTDWGRSRGVGVVRYATEAEANRAIETLRDSNLGGRNLTVDHWTGSSGKWREEQAAKGIGKGGMKGFGKGFGKGPLMYGKGYLPKGWGKGLGKSIQVNGDPKQLVYVGNLPYQVRWQDLKDHMKTAGTVEFCKVLTEDGTEWGWSKGVGCVRFSTEEEATKAISTLNETELKGRKILVDHWTAGAGKGAAAASAGAPSPPPAAS